MAIDRYREMCERHRWQVPEDFNIARAVCGRHAADPGRVAMYWEDEDGARDVVTFARLQEQANRLANALRALGVARGDRVAIVLPQRPETAAAHLACYQLGAVTLPLSFLFGPEALEYRLADAEAKVAIVDAASIEGVSAVRERVPTLRHLVGVAGASGPGVHDWSALLARAATQFEPVGTRARDPAVLIYTSGTTGPPKGALMPQQALLGNLPGFTCSHDGFPLGNDVFWSPADWAWTGGLMDALLPALYFGCPIVGFRGRFDPERALVLMERYRVTAAFLFPTALKMMMKAVPRPRDGHALALRSVMSAGEAVGSTVFGWSQESLGITVNEMFGQTEMNYIVGNSQANWPARPGSMGRPYPGHRITLIDDAGAEVADGELGEVAVNRIAPDGVPDPVFFLGYFHNDEATVRKYSGDWCRTGDLATRDGDGYLWYQGRADDMFKAAGYRIGPSEIENCLVRHPAVANAAVVPSPDETRGNVVKAFIVLAAGSAPSADLEQQIRDHVRKHLAPYEYPKEIEFIDALPMTTTGKVQRRVLREREQARKR
jgi:acetyl-CoA synthetase